MADRDTLKFSFIVPVHGATDTLERCVQSIIGEQSYTNTEVILVLDGPNSPAKRLYSRRWKDNAKVKLIEQDHGGAPKARNRGAEEATGDILVFWDHDSFAYAGIIRTWYNILMKFTDVDFLYGAYRFRIGDQLSGHFPSIPFDPYLFTTANQASTMSPMRRKVFPGWDESLEKFQDWDLWLRVIQGGGKGLLIPGIQFDTSPPAKDSISGGKISYEEAALRIRKKHNIGPRKIRVSCFADPAWGISVAKMLGADFDNEGGRTRGFGNELVYMMGFYNKMLIQHINALQAGEEKTKVVHWLGTDALMMHRMPYADLKGLELKDMQGLVTTMNQRIHHHLCNSNEAKGLLSGIGIEARDMPIPTEMPAKAVAVPGKGKGAFLFEGVGYEDLFRSLKKALPDVPLEQSEGGIPMDSFKALIRMSPVSYRDPEVIQFLLLRRWAITNMTEPHFGFVGTIQKMGPAKIKAKLVERIRGIFYGEGKQGAHKAADYYREYFGRRTTERFLEGLLNGQKEPRKGKRRASTASV